jgi:hypothetical protein
MDVISPEADQLVKGSHGRLTDDPREGPIFISSDPDMLSGTPPGASVHATRASELMLAHVFG